MGLTYLEAAKRLTNPLARGAALAIATSDEMMSLMEVKTINADADAIPREGTLGADPDFVAPEHTSVTEGTGTDDVMFTRLRILIGDVDVPTFIENQVASSNKLAGLVSKKLKATGRKIAAKAIAGQYAGTPTYTAVALGGVTLGAAGPFQDSRREGPATIRFTLAGALLSYRAPGDRSFGTPVAVTTGTYTLTSDNPSKTIVVTTVAGSLPAANTEANVDIGTSTFEPDGLLKMIPASQVVASTGANGDALGFATLDSLLYEKVKISAGRRAFIGNAKMKMKFLALLRAAGGNTAGQMAIPGVNGPVPTYAGVPFLQNDNIPFNEVKGSGTTLSSVLLVNFSEDEGGFYTAAGRGEVNETMGADPARVRVFGTRVRVFQELEAKEAMRARVSWYGAFGLGSILSCARASELVTA